MSDVSGYTAYLSQPVGKRLRYVPDVSDGQTDVSDGVNYLLEGMENGLEDVKNVLDGQEDGFYPCWHLFAITQLFISGYDLFL